MLVENRMKRDPITISPETGVLEASRLLRQHRIRHLPVVRGGRLVGILTDRDLGEPIPILQGEGQRPGRPVTHSRPRDVSRETTRSAGSQLTVHRSRIMRL